MDSDRFSISYDDQPPLEIPLEVAQEGLGPRGFIDAGIDKIKIISPVNFTYQDLINFFEAYAEGEKYPLTFNSLLGVITVADYLGYDFFLDEILIPRFVKALIHQRDELRSSLKSFRDRYSFISPDIKDLIELKLETLTEVISLGNVTVLTPRESKSGSPFPKSKKDIKIQIVTDDLNEKGRPKVAGFVNFNKDSLELSDRESLIYTDILPLKQQLYYPSSGVILYKSLQHFFPRSGRMYFWLSYTPNSLAITQQTLLGISSCQIRENNLICNDLRGHFLELFQTLKYGLVMVGEKLGPFTVEMMNPFPEWQFTDEEDRQYYVRHWADINQAQNKMVFLKSTINGRNFFFIYLDLNDKYVVDNAGEYMFVFRFKRQLIELYEINEKRRIFKQVVEDVNPMSHTGTLEVDTINEYLRIYYRTITDSHIYQVYNFKGELLHANSEMPFYSPSNSIKNSNIVVLSGEMFRTYQPNPGHLESQVNLGRQQYGLFLRDPVTLELTRFLLVTGNESEIPGVTYDENGNYILSMRTHQEDIAVSRDGYNFTYTNGSTIYYFRVFPKYEDEIEELKDLLKVEEIKS